MFSTPFICCSIGVATDCSMVIESAPGYCPWIWMSGGTMSGNCSTGRLKSATSPPRNVSRAMTIATTGRLMKKRAIYMFSVERRALRPPSSSLDRPHVRFVVRADHCDLIDALQLVDRALRNDHCRPAHVGHRADLRELAGPQEIAGIGEEA